MKQWIYLYHTMQINNKWLSPHRRTSFINRAAAPAVALKIVQWRAQLQSVHACLASLDLDLTWLLVDELASPAIPYYLFDSLACASVHRPCKSLQYVAHLLNKPSRSHSLMCVSHFQLRCMFIESHTTMWTWEAKSQLSARVSKRAHLIAT